MQIEDVFYVYCTSEDNFFKLYIITACFSCMSLLFFLLYFLMYFSFLHNSRAFTGTGRSSEESARRRSFHFHLNRTRPGAGTVFLIQDFLYQSFLSVKL